jgi:hypothetical protein
MIARHGLRLLGSLLALAAAGWTSPPAHAQALPREGTFSARWVVTGTWRGLGLASEREIIFADLGGRLDVTPNGGALVDLASRCFVFWDSATSGTARCRWRHPSGDEIFSEVEGGLLAQGAPVTGRFVGGTGRYAGLAGEFRFDGWSTLYIEREPRESGDPEGGDLAITAFTNELSGSWRLP